MSILETILSSITGYAEYLWKDITFQSLPWYNNFFWWLVLLSLSVWGLELAFPWRKKQSAFRKDFWLDTFYMFFNFFIFQLIIFSWIKVFSFKSFSTVLNNKVEVLSLFELKTLPYLLQVVIFFLIMDFVQWAVHNLLHRVPFLWRFHKIHHSVKEMGFAAHFRYHWIETIVYEPFKYMALLLIGGFEPSSVFVIYYINITIGHLNHANIGLSYGPLKYIINNPKMHIWHHAKVLPEGTKGVNFGISLSVWDYMFGTAHLPSDGRDIELGFNGDEKFPENFTAQMTKPFTK